MAARRGFRRPVWRGVVALVGLALLTTAVALLRGLGLADAAMATALAAGMVFVFAGLLQRSSERAARLLESREPVLPGSWQPSGLIVVGCFLLLLGVALRLVR